MGLGHTEACLLKLSLLSSVSENPQSEGICSERLWKAEAAEQGPTGRWRLDTEAAVGRQPRVSCLGHAHISLPPGPRPAPQVLAPLGATLAPGQAPGADGLPTQPGSAMPGCRWRERRLSQEGQSGETARGRGRRASAWRAHRALGDSHRTPS